MFITAGLLLVLSVIIISGCQKELSVETNVLPAGTAATGTLKDTTGNCLPYTVKGTFYNGVATADSNYVQVQLNAYTTGSFSIQTSVQNGFQLSATGVITNPGINTINLKASGTPVNINSTNFNIIFDGNNCVVTVNVQDSSSRTGGTPAVFTLGGAPNACTNAVFTGNYNTGTALNGANTVVIPVNVTTIGSYSISTAVVNGYKFSASGKFITTGIQNVSLSGSGTPIKAEKDTLNPTVGTSTCSFSLTVSAAAVASFTLSGSPNACSNSMVNGSYFQGTSLNATNTVFINVNVATAGTYTLKSDSVNGMAFSASGVFTTTGPQSVTLLGNGAPATSTNTTFNLTTSTNNCSFTVPVTAATSPCDSLTQNLFTLTASGTQYNLSGASTVINLTNYQLQITGPSNVEELIISFPGNNAPTAGVYAIGSAVSMQYTDPGFLTDAITWNATSGNVTVSVNANTGQILLQFCNIAFTGTSPLNSTTHSGIGRGQENGN